MTAYTTARARPVANPTDHLATVRAALDTLAAHVPTVEGAYGIAGLIALGNAAPAIAALADECERLRKESRTWFRGEAERQAARADALESALRAILDAPIGPEEHDAMTAARRLLGGK